MKDAIARNVISGSVLPMLLGDNKDSRRLARRLFWHFNLRSHIFARKCSLTLSLMLSAVFSPLPDSDSDEFVLMTVERFAAEHDEMTFLLVTCSKEAEAFIEKNRSALENRFLIRSYSETIASLNQDEKAPYHAIYQKKGSIK